MRSSQSSNARPATQSPEGVEFVLKSRKRDIAATALLEKNGQFIVQAGSQARARRGGPEASAYAHLFTQLALEHILQSAGDIFVFSENYAFHSPSAAATVVLGYSANGTIVWKTRTGQTYKAWEAEQVTGQCSVEGTHDHPQRDQL
jgi:hypothetical protein